MRIPMRAMPSYLLFLPAALFMVAACSKQGAKPGPIAAPDRGRATSTQADDQGRCEFKGRADREVSESSSPGSLLPNVRRIYQVVQFGEERRRILSCREVDTNLDGIKDVIRHYDEKGEPLREEADSDYDGKIDTWLLFSGGRLIEEQSDTNGDGQPDVWKYYVLGDNPDASEEQLAKAPLRLQRVQRDSNFDSKPDIWEFYERGRLERVGFDLDFDGRVDRWDHDVVARQAMADEVRKQSASTPSGAASSGAPANSPPPEEDEN